MLDFIKKSQDLYFLLSDDFSYVSLINLQTYSLRWRLLWSWGYA